MVRGWEQPSKKTPQPIRTEAYHVAVMLLVSMWVGADLQRRPLMALPKLYSTSVPNLKRDTPQARAGITKYYADVDIAGLGRRRPLLGRDFELAKDRLAALVKSLREQALGIARFTSTTGPQKLRDVQTHHLTARQDGSADRKEPLARNTLAKYLVADRKALEWFGSEAWLHEVTKDSVITWLRERDEEVGPAVVNRDLKRIKAVYDWAVEQGWADFNPLAKLRYRREPELEIVPLTTLEKQALEWHCAPWLWDMWRFACLTGLRQREQLTLTWSQIRGHLLRVTAEVSKTRKSRIVSMPDAALDILERQRGLHDTLVFPSFTGVVWDRNNLMHRHWRPAVKEAGLKGCTWHRARHEFISGLIAAGVDSRVVMELAGHSDEKIMRRYTHFSPEFLRDKVNLLK